MKVALVLEATAAAVLGDLERRLDARAFRAAAQLAARWRGRKRPPPAEPPVSTDPVAAASPLAALKGALTAGALESAAGLLDAVLQAPNLLQSGGADAQALAIETLLMLGERERAALLGAKHESTLARSASGAAVLELLGSTVASDLLPDGRPHLLRLSRRLERGELKASELVRLLGVQPFAFLRSPELHLLYFSALVESEPQRALAFLNRFLALHGALAARLEGDAGNVLERLSFSAPARGVSAGPLVSVLVPTYNASRTIGYAIESLLRQSYAPLEVLVGDDASSDDTLEILRRRAASEQRLRLFRSTRNQGPYNLKNALAHHARGELLTFHDADDLALPDRIARQVEAMQVPGSVACIANFARVRPSGSFVFFKDQHAVRLGMVTLMLTRKAFATAGPFRSARIGADLELYAALRAHFGPTAIARVRSPVMLGLWSPSSATRTAGSESLEDGYRSPARRAYSEIVCQHGGAPAGLTDADVVARLRETGNYVEPAALEPVT